MIELPIWLFVLGIISLAVTTTLAVIGIIVLVVSLRYSQRARKARAEKVTT